MKRFFVLLLSLGAMATPAAAADLPVKMPAPYNPPPTFSWTGCYLGANGMAGRSTDEWDPFTGTPLGSAHPNGFLGGGQVGCDYQTGPLVFGMEGQFDWGDMHGKTFIPAAGGGGFQLDSKINELATVTGRAGYAIGRVLLYGKGGFAWAHVRDEFDVLFAAGGAPTPDFIGATGIVGWTAGGGFEVAFLQHWSAKVEYSYYDFGTNGVSLTCQSVATCGTPGVAIPFNIKSNIQTVMLGLNYRFGAGWFGPND